MTHSVIDVTCNYCSNTFTGVLYDLLHISKEYAATCPSCNKQTFIKDRAAIIDTPVPDDAVEILYVTDPINKQ